MLSTIGEIITAIFAVIGIYEIVSQICNYFIRRTKYSLSYKTQVRITLNKTNAKHAEFVIRSLLSNCDNGILKDAEIVIVDDGIDEDAKKVCKIFEEAVSRVHVEIL